MTLRQIFLFGVLLPAAVTILVFVIFLVCCFRSNIYARLRSLAKRAPPPAPPSGDGSRSNGVPIASTADTWPAVAERPTDEFYRRPAAGGATCGGSMRYVNAAVAAHTKPTANHDAPYELTDSDGSDNYGHLVPVEQTNSAPRRWFMFGRHSAPTCSLPTHVQTRYNGR